MGNVAIFAGNFAKLLKANINLFGKAYILTGTQDPRSVATDAPKGSILMRQTPSGNGEVFWKLDDGLTTNWSDLGFPGSSIVDLYNPVSTSLPTTGPVTIDGTLLEDGNTVLFSNLSVNNKRIYKASLATTPGTWTSHSAATADSWDAVTWAAELNLFVAVSGTGTGDRVMTSPDGITWTSQVSAADLVWTSVCWSSELSLFVAVASSGTGNRVMSSPDGIIWTSQTSAADNNWTSVCWSSELSLFVAVANSGSTNRVMSSPDGVTWTIRTAANNNNWQSVTWSPELNLFAAVASSTSFTNDEAMTSPDGITWTVRASALDVAWESVTWSSYLGLFAAVAANGQAMTSSDGITWTLRTTPGVLSWTNVIWADTINKFIAVGQSGTGNRVMSSPDGITWTTESSAADNVWSGVAWSPSLLTLAAVAESGANRIMTNTYSETVSWTVQSNFQNGLDASSGDRVQILNGLAFQGQEAYYDQNGDFVINDTVRFFDGPNGTNFWELGSVKTATLLDNQSAPADVFSVAYAGSENWVIPYSISRNSGTSKETGQIYLTVNSSGVAITRNNAYLGDVGVTFTADINGNNLRLRYVTTSTGSDAVMKLFSMRWSDSSGGPTGIPSYTGSGGSSTPAAGTTGDVQFKGISGNLDATDSFKWDPVEDAINLNGLLIGAKQGPDTLADNQVSPATVFSFASTNKFSIVEYGVQRNGDTQVGRLLVTTNGTAVSISDDFTSTAGLGITFSAVISGGNVEIQYISTNTGFTGSMTYSITRW